MPLNFLPLAVILVLLAPQLSAILDTGDPILFDDNAGIKKFNSTKEISEYLKKNMQTRSYGYSYLSDASPEINILAGSSEKSSLASIFSATGDYSATNVQVAGVDEADFVKNDGRYIYVISNNRLVIVDAYPAEKAKIISETTFDGTAGDMFLNGDDLVIFTTDHGYRVTAEREGILSRLFGISAKEVAPRYSGQMTHALVYSIRNKAKPVLEKDICVDGTYFNSRMIGDYVYMITKEQIYYYDDPVPVPMISEGGDKWSQPDVYYFNNPESSYVFHTVTSFYVNGGTGVKSKTFLMGATNTMYVSEDNIYISYPVYNNYAVPVTRSTGIFGTGTFSAIEDAFNQLTESEKGEALSDARAGSVKPTVYTTRTVIHKLAIDRGNVDYRSKGEVTGTLLDQFSMDEHDGKLRVATTVNTYGGSAPYMYNNVYVLDANMKEVGSIEKIAPDEKIYSTRFIGDRLYMVTFRQLDPFFVIDLSNPYLPKVLGALKIPGYSDYLHPYDANHVIGIGKETTTNQWGGVSAKGLKIALFDVSDVSSPKLVDKFEIGDSGTDSEALRDHRAVLFDKTKGILVIPVREVGYVPVIEPGKSYSTYKYRDAAYVFSISPSKGIDIQGVIAHSNDGSWDTVKRSLYIGDVLYTISGQKIVMSDLNDLKEPIGEVTLSSYYPILYD
jgi:uncharacterized secreted protein with C-terminal beta-propeller domain